MKSIYKDLNLRLFYFLLISMSSLYTNVIFAQNVNFSGSIYNLKHNFQCDNDGVGGFIYDNYPHPRWQLRFGYNNYTYSNVTDNADYGSGASSTYGPPGRLACNTFTKTITLPSFTSVPADYVRVDMRSWEEDESFTPCCVHHQNEGNSGNGTCCVFGLCDFCVNADDNCYGWASIGSINFWDNAPPCATKKYYGAFNTGTFLSTHGRNGGGSCGGESSSYDGANAGDYGIERLDLYWDFASAPTIATQPNDVSYGGSVRDVCSGLPITLSVVSNAFHGWTLGRWVKWQSAPDVAGSPGTWTDIAGTLNVTANTTQNTFTYTYTPGVAGTTHYRAVLSSACSNTFAALVTNSSSVKVIVHDAATDPFCTAPACDVIYVDPVNGSDVFGNGRPTTPYKTISKAATANPTYIRVAKGTGTDANIVQIPSNCVIEGGYVRSVGALERWEKSSDAADKTIITFSGSEAITGVRHVAAFKSDGKTDWTVKDIDVITTSTPAGVYDASDRGMSNYGFLIINSSARYTLSRVNISVGNAGAGSDGATPVDGGGIGGSNGGGPGNNRSKCNSGTAATSGTGGTGANGTSAVNNNSNNGTNGSMGKGGVAAGSSGGCCGPQKGGDGGTGGTGGIGGSWVLGNKPLAVAVINASCYIPAGQSVSGGNGGGGGGGGGGNRGGVNCACFGQTGNISGQGGAGGTGGTGGAGGAGGGGVFGVWQYNSNVGVLIQEVNISSLGNVGLGGLGADGSNGISGSSSSSVYSWTPCAVSETPALGGKGGTGGNGGRGRDGADGTSAATVVNGTPTAALTATIPFLSTITLDNFSQRSNISGKMCNNSEIDIKNTTGFAFASLPSGLSLVSDLTPSLTSYSLSSLAFKVTTDDANKFYNLTVSTTPASTSLNKFLYTAVANRSLPAVVVTPATKVICKGSSFDLNKSNSYDAGAIQQYEYIVFADGNTANTPYGGGSYNSTNASYTTPTFSSTGKYWVRYRERHNCCGWSRPVFESFNVIDAPNAPTAISVNGPLCFASPLASFTINVTGTKAYTLFDSWELFDTDPSFGTPTPIQTSTNNNPSFTVTPAQTTTYFVRGKNVCSATSALSVTAIVVGDQSSNGVISTTNSSKICVVNDALWHYFRNDAGEIIAAINSNGINLGNVKMEVTIETTVHDGIYVSPKHGNGGLGRNGTCFGVPELSMRRWYAITPDNKNPATASTIKLFFTNDDYSNYTTELGTWNTSHGNMYPICYGTTAAANDLAVSKDEINDAVISAVPSVGGGPNGSTEYELTIPSFSTFRFHTKGGIGMPLPVELTTFTGYNDGDKNILNWITASELNTDRFEIEKSNQPQQWINIGSVQAAGNSNTPRTYTFNDIHPAIGDNYYRLKMMDLDGTFKYSNVINITVNEVPNNGFISIFPNPTSGDVTILIQSKVANKSRLSIVNMLGQELISKDISLQKGLNNLQIETSYLASGAYTISFTDETGKRYIHKLIKN